MGTCALFLYVLASLPMCMCVGGKDMIMDLHNILRECRLKLKTWRKLHNLFLKSTLLQMLLHQALIIAD